MGSSVSSLFTSSRLDRPDQSFRIDLFEENRPGSGPLELSLFLLGDVGREDQDRHFWSSGLQAGQKLRSIQSDPVEIHHDHIRLPAADHSKSFIEIPSIPHHGHSRRLPQPPDQSLSCPGVPIDNGDRDRLFHGHSLSRRRAQEKCRMGYSMKIFVSTASRAGWP